MARSIGKRRTARALPAPDPSTVGGFVEPLAFGTEARKTLAKYLDAESIEALREWCETARDMYAAPRHACAGELRATLTELANAAQALAVRLARSDATVNAHLDLAGVRVARDFRWHDRLAADLQALATELDRQADALPEQTRRAAPVGALRPIAEVCAAAGIAISASPTSRFVAIAKVCFHAIGLSSPDHAARKLADETVRKAPR